MGADERAIWILYRNHRGVTAWRHVLPLVWDFVESPWHPGRQWVMQATDLGKGERRTFAIGEVLRWSSGPPGGSDVASAAGAEATMRGDQPPPVPNDRPAVWDLVRADMAERDRVGRQRYGTPLQPLNGRDALQDAYFEALDLVVYLRQEIEERRLMAGRGHFSPDVLIGLRARGGLGVQELADTLGVSRNTLTSWEAGRTEPTVSEFVRLARACGGDPAEALARAGKGGDS